MSLNFAYPSIDMERTGKNIAKLRKESGYSVQQLSDIMGFTSPQAVYKWQHGKCLPTVDNLVFLSKIFNTSMDSILVLNEGRDVVVYGDFLQAA